jgi:hypothetical protein
MGTRDTLHCFVAVALRPLFHVYACPRSDDAFSSEPEIEGVELKAEIKRFIS